MCRCSLLQGSLICLFDLVCVNNSLHIKYICITEFHIMVQFPCNCLHIYVLCYFYCLDIEELTRKTGNFKKFAVFLNMLESAIMKSSESVTLDLLTYGDLEAMWKKKLGSSKNQGEILPGTEPQAKRYLILTYNAEFDRIHYPLALSYCGCPDPMILQDTIRKLQMELDRARKQVRVYIRFSVLIKCLGVSESVIIRT